MSEEVGHDPQSHSHLFKCFMNVVLSIEFDSSYIHDLPLWSLLEKFYSKNYTTNFFNVKKPTKTYFIPNIVKNASVF